MAFHQRKRTVPRPWKHLSVIPLPFNQLITQQCELPDLIIFHDGLGMQRHRMGTLSEDMMLPASPSVSQAAMEQEAVHTYLKQNPPFLLVFIPRGAKQTGLHDHQDSNLSNSPIRGTRLWGHRL